MTIKKIFSIIIISALLLSLCSCASGTEASLNLTKEPKPASEYTAEINKSVYNLLDFTDTTEQDFAKKGLIDAPEVLELTDSNGEVIWSQKAYGFMDEYSEAPDTVNPSLWQNTLNNRQYGLFKVCDGIYQVRGYDMANLTLIEGKTGWIVIDTLMTIECAEAAMQLVEKNLGQRPVKAVIISHSHVDHYGGIKGVMSDSERADDTLTLEEQIESGLIPIIVPQGYTQHSVSESIYSGTAMARRANYQYGVFLEPSPIGTLAMGIGLGQSTGLSSFIKPTYEIKSTGETYTIDDVKIEFQMTPDTEAPAEMNLWLPEKNALWLAENCTSTLHNLYTLRGAQIRDGYLWSHYILEALSLYGNDAQVVFQSHNWPHWGNDTIKEYLENTAAVYKFITDQTLTYINQGYTSDEISNMIKLPEDLEKVWYTRQYYGTVAHNSKAVYQKYMGWYDSNPVHLNPLTPSESAEKWVEYLGDTERVLKLAKEDFDKGEYQWVAEITNVLVFADPKNTDARLLCADALEQLGYQAESGTWRNSYLSAAKELRDGNQALNEKGAKYTGDTQRNMTAEMTFTYMGIVMDKQAMEDKDVSMNVKLTDTNKQYNLKITNGVLLVFNNVSDKNADVSITCATPALNLITSGNPANFGESIKIEGNAEILNMVTENMNQFDITKPSNFNIIEP